MPPTAECGSLRLVRCERKHDARAHARVKQARTVQPPLIGGGRASSRSRPDAPQPENDNGPVHGPNRRGVPRH